MKRFLIAGFQHETNTFAPGETAYSEFERADSWPELLRGKRVITGTRGLNLPMAGFIAKAERHDTDLVPLLWCFAEPAGPVSRDAFERIMAEILSGIEAGGNIDGIFLELHGAMVTADHECGEAEILRRVRAVVGDNMPIAVALDLHANISGEMVKLADTIAIYRTYPHLDMAETGARSFHQLMRLAEGWRPAKAFRQIPFLLPLHAQYTGTGPCRDLYDLAVSLSNPPDQTAEIALGFTASDVSMCGPSVVTCANDQTTADQMADRIVAAFLAAENRFDCSLTPPDEAVRQAMASTTERPVVIADVQDNAGAGGSSDTTGLLSALVTEGAQNAVLGLLCDPDVTQTAHALGEGETFHAALGGKSGMSDQSPFTGEFLIEKIDPGNAGFTGAMYGGGVAILGKSAVLREISPDADVRVVVTSHRSQCLDLGLFTHFGIEPEKCRIICVKSTVHFRADFGPIADRIINIDAPGLVSCKPQSLDYRHLRNGVRLCPGGPVQRQ